MKQIAHTAEFIEEMKKKLEEEKLRLESSLARVGSRKSDSDYDADFPDYGDDEDENAMEVADFETNLGLEKELEKALRDVKKALERIANNNYGIDKYTGELISEDRLRARPTSTTSVESKKTLTQEL